MGVKGALLDKCGGGEVGEQARGEEGLEGMSEVDRKQRELYSKQQQLLREQRSQDMQKLLDCISGESFTFFVITAAGSGR